MGVGFKSFSTLSSAYMPVGVCQERVREQLRRLRIACAPSPIIQHPDVRRMLMTQKLCRGHASP